MNTDIPLLSKEFYVAYSKSIQCDFFLRKLMKYGRCAVVGRWRGPSCAYVDFFPPADSVSHEQPACVWECICIQHPRGQKRPGKCGAMSKWCWLFSLTPMGWCITSMHHKAKTLTKNTTWKSFVAFMMPCGERDWTYGQRERGSCIMTTHQLILATDSNFLGQTQHSCGSTGSLLSQHGSLRFLAVPPPENAAERDSIWVTRHYMEHNSQAVLHSQRGIPEMLWTMAEPLGEVCSVGRRLLRRGLGLQASRRVNVFFLAKGRILFEQATYCSMYSLLRKEYSVYQDNRMSVNYKNATYVTPHIINTKIMWPTVLLMVKDDFILKNAHTCTWARQHFPFKSDQSYI